MKRLKHRSTSPALILGVIVVCCVVIIGIFFLLKKNLSYPEIKTISSGKMKYKELADLFISVSNKKGAEYAYNLLKVAPIPPNIDIHLLGHVVGDKLFEQKGANGISICTNDFRNACSHSIVIGLFSQKGDAALSEINKACHKAPGGGGAYTMCFHGLGHGILAYTGYDMAKTIQICKKTGTPTYQYREYIECGGGAVMEIIGGGFHDREIFKKQQKKYLDKENPLGLCFSNFMPDELKPQCLIYITPFLFISAGAKLDHPSANYFEKAFEYCKTIPQNYQNIKLNCYAGFGKEFIVLAQNRDIRINAMSRMTNKQLKTVYEWCLLAKDRDGAGACIISTVNSLFWGGEIGPDPAIKFCNSINDPGYQASCFDNLNGAVSYYIKNVNMKKEFCNKLPETYKKICLQRLSISQ